MDKFGKELCTELQNSELFNTIYNFLDIKLILGDILGSFGAGSKFSEQQLLIGTILGGIRATSKNLNEVKDKEKIKQYVLYIMALGATVTQIKKKLPSKECWLVRNGYTNYHWNINDIIVDESTDNYMVFSCIQVDPKKSGDRQKLKFVRFELKPVAFDSSVFTAMYPVSDIFDIAIFLGVETSSSSSILFPLRELSNKTEFNKRMEQIIINKIKI